MQCQLLDTARGMRLACMQQQSGFFIYFIVRKLWH